MSTRVKLFRWRAILPLLLFVALMVLLWVLFADAFARRQAQSTLSSLLGTEVDIASLHIRATDAAIDIGGLAVADPRHPERNVLEAGGITFDLDPIPLLKKKFVLDNLKLTGLRFYTARATPARPADPSSPSSKILEETEAWARDKFQFPKLVLGRVDSLKSLVLKPEQLGTVQAARSFAGRVDSVQGAFEQSLGQLQLKALADSSSALATRLSKTDPKSLGLAGAKNTAGQVQKAIEQVKQAKARLATLEQATKTSLGSLEQGLADVEAARQRDYAFAKSQLGLPSFDAPNIGAALFGQQSTNYFQSGVHYAKVAQRYVPPGLQPWNRPGPKRTRMAGTTVEFPKEHEDPRFLLKHGTLGVAVGAAGQNLFKGEVSGITSQPSLYGRPATLVASGRLAAESPVSIDLAGMSRHFGAAPLDSVNARVGGAALPPIVFPDLPFTLDPGASNVAFRFAMTGDRLDGAWELGAEHATWSADSARLRSASLVESTVWKVVSGLTQLHVRAELGGTIASPTIKVSSNLDDAIAQRLRGLVNEQVAGAEQKARAAVDSLVGPQVAALRTKVGGLNTEVANRIPAEKGELDRVQKSLEDQLKRIAGGGLRLPKL